MLKNLLTAMFVWLVCSTAFAETYYWVGGTGNWSDISHWATSSGGDVFYEEIPGADDDVIFDQSSFFGPDQMITIDVARAFCRNFIWTQAQNFPTFDNLASSTLVVNGDFRLIPQMNYDFNGTLFFRGTGPQEVQSYGHILGNNVYFDDEEGDWTVISPLGVSNALFFRRGVVDVQGAIATNYLHIVPDVDVNVADFSFQEDILIRSSNRGSGADIFESFKVLVDQANVVFAPDLEIELIGGNSTIRIEGISKTLFFPNIHFSNISGNQRIQAENGSNHTFASLIFNANTRIDFSATIDALSLSAGRTHFFGANQLFQISDLNAQGSCTSPIYIFSTSRGTTASFTTPTIVTGDYMNIRDIEIVDGRFEVTNAKDLGNISGWSLTDLGSQDLYWVGGTGLWSDQNHWSFTSGGPGGACVPSPIDNVFFDENSFNGAGQSVTLDLAFSYCQDMTWMGVLDNPSMVFGGRSLNVGGSLVLDPNMQFNANGILRLDAFRSSHVITSSGHDLGRDVRLEAIGGSYTMSDDLTINGTFRHVYGTLDTDGFTMNLVRYFSNYGSSRSLDISGSTVNVRAIPGLSVQWEIGSNGYTLNAANSQINAIAGLSLVHRGNGSLEYDRVVFNATGNLYNYNAGQSSFNYVSIGGDGYLYRDHQIDTLVLSPSQSYLLSSGSVQRVGRLESIGSCQEPISIRASSVGEEAFFETDRDDSEINTTMVKDIHVRGAGIFRNVNGIDNGNIDGWDIKPNVPRVLYWVGEGGNWNDPQHWSASPDGPGGECIPTSIDDVIFDEHSFSLANQVVSGANIFFRNMSWNGVTNRPAVSFSQALTYGSITLSEDMDINAWTWIYLLGDDTGSVLDTKGKSFTHLNLNAIGEWTLTSPINAAGQFYLYNGGLKTGGHDIRTERIRIWERNYLNIDLSSSTINLFGDGVSTPQFAQYQSDAAVLDFDSGTSTINIEHANGYTLVGSDEVNLYDLHFLSPNGRGRMDVRTTDRISYNKVMFNGNGLILREHAIDSLIFATGKSYTLQSQKTQIVNDYWEIMGLPCAPITLNATTVGSPATVEMINGTVETDYINMRDQIAIGSLFNAGQHSTDIGRSNQGWVFEEISEDNPERGILGSDQVLCDDSSIDLKAFSPTQNLTYEWNDGSQDREYTAVAPGTYWVDVTFAANCQVRDSVEIMPQIYSNTDLGEDMTMCEGDTLILDVALDGGTYLWQDNDEGPIRSITESGQYYVQVDYLGCPNSDTLNIAFDPVPQPDLGVNQIACQDEIVTLSPNADFDIITWNNGASTDQLEIEDSGIYWVDITKGVCTNRDSVQVEYFDLENFLGQDTSMCQGDRIRLSFEGDPLVNYEWSDGSQSNLISVDEAGVYGLTLYREGCEVYDEIEVTMRPTPTLTIDQEISICEGDTEEIIAQSNGDRFEWSNGDMTQNTFVDEEGSYQVIAYLDDCPTNDYITVFVDERPELDLGSDTTICTQRPIALNLGYTPAEVLWSDGSNQPIRDINQSGNYAVTLINGACEVEDEINVIAEECKEFAVYAPNIFSPDGDGVNDEFLPLFDQSILIEQYRLMIFNRWGGIVFETENLDEGWDGTLNGKPLQRGNYVYTMQFSYTDELQSGEESVNGDVFLAR